MRIVGKLKQDYYDTCLGFGVDETLTYVRDTYGLEEDEAKEFIVKTGKGKERFGRLGPREFSKTIRGSRKTYDVRSGYIGFCGKIYPFLSITHNDYSNYKFTKESTYHYTAESFFDEFKKLGLSMNESDRKYYWGRGFSLTEKNIHTFLGEWENTDVFFDIGNPAFVIYDSGEYTRDKAKSHVTVNPKLADFAFYRAVDPYTAFQEISMFLGGVLGGVHPPMVEITDKEMAKKKGFGHKYAFRKEPESMRK